MDIIKKKLDVNTLKLTANIKESDYISNRIESEVYNLNDLPEDDDFGDEDGHDGNY